MTCVRLASVAWVVQTRAMWEDDVRPIVLVLVLVMMILLVVALVLHFVVRRAV